MFKDSRCSDECLTSSIQPPLVPLDDLKKREDIVISPADKGRCTVVMDKTEYHAKVDSLLADRKFYKLLDKRSNIHH